MKLRLLAVAILALTALIVVPLVASARAPRLGVILPLTGPHAKIGVGMRNAIRLAVEELNARGGAQGQRVELFELDDASNPARAVAAAKELVDNPSVRGAVVHYDPECATAAHLVYAAAQLANVLAGVDSRDMHDLVESPSEFRILPLGNALMEPAAKYAFNTLGARRFVFVRDETPIGEDLLGGFRAGLSPLVGRVVLEEEGVAQQNPDFAPVLEKIRREDADYVLFGGQVRVGGRLLKAMRAAGSKARFQMGGHFPSPDFIEEAGAAAEGALAIWEGAPTGDTPAGRRFLAAYNARFPSEEAGPYGLFAYAAAQAMLEGMDKSFLTRPSVTGALGSQTFATALGPVKFFFLGSTYSRRVLYEVRGGKWVPFLEANASGTLAPYTAK